MTNQPLLVKPSELARMLGVSKPTIYRAIAAGALPAVVVGRQLRVPREQLEVILKRGLPFGGPKKAQD